jgi:LytS/YehU family sensor histidine kinase
MSNIQSRLKIFYNHDKIMDIHSEPEHGTEVILCIPSKTY